MSDPVRPLNRKAHLLALRRRKDVEGYSFSECSSVFAPGWEVSEFGDPDPCPWKHDLEMCWATCFWTGQVPDMYMYPQWLGACANINMDWRNLCTIPDH
ncbi:MAG: quinohemoprotein amine dehydrogenase subunit gamma [Myxococcota bacterium]|jgi:hypothetical protein|nr:quinohemoprotein amine dehydrogenase subunit gamma [Myxococcota bacterium]